MLRIETGHQVTGDIQVVEAQAVRFVAEDNRTMFEVSALKDGSGIEVRAVDATVRDGVLHEATILVSPRTSNMVMLTTPKYGEGA